MGLTAGNAAGYRGGARNTGIEDFLVLPAVPVVPLLPGPALRDGLSHVLGLRIVVPEALRRLAAPAVAAAAMFTSPGVAASPMPAVAAAAIFGRLVNSGAYLSFSPVFFHSQREGVPRLGRSAVHTALVRAYTTDSPAVGSRC